MNSMSDVRRHLKKFGTFIYTKDRLLDLELMEEEWQELYKWKMIEKDDYVKGLQIIRAERRREGENKNDF